MTNSISQLTAMSGNSTVIMSLKITQQQRMSSTQDQVPSEGLLWLAVSESGISEPVFFKAGLAVNKEMFISKCLPVLYFINLSKNTTK
jgi:hypothetical protein